MNWQEVCEHASLQNLPFKIELNKKGQIIMSPAKVYHSAYQGEIEYFLRVFLKQGKTLPECAIWTRDGTKVADVGWVSKERFSIIKNETECSIAPEICIEVLSSSNTENEMIEKCKLYFEQKAKEVWICSQKGKMSFYNPDGQIKKSNLVPKFPNKIEI
ncbi:MAG: Uma2 family endonuclease [Gammaproteobacteria bacterium]|nr:MAG: Uma2 family endonuclease [Gammaproteobacteria bacterium]RKZ45130.1 MAG: Uma2 family endonuclease [Gammaproteobacteria bacterium]RKZ75539.1 MAG: Uma2 family endonuclease [Gammaproteobacteria bacterium]